MHSATAIVGSATAMRHRMQPLPVTGCSSNVQLLPAECWHVSGLFSAHLCVHGPAPIVVLNDHLNNFFAHAAGAMHCKTE
jgi:hypothetical protein